MEKAAAEKEALRLWRARPLQERLSYGQAVAFAAMIAPTLEFETLGNHDKVVEGWLVRDLMRTEAATKIFDEQQAKAAPKYPVNSTTPATPKEKPQSSRRAVRKKSA